MDTNLGKHYGQNNLKQSVLLTYVVSEKSFGLKCYPM